MVYTGFTYRLAYRRATLRQATKGGMHDITDSWDKLHGHLMGCPLIIQTESSASNSIDGSFIVPDNEIWLLYSISLRITGGTVPHPMFVSIDRYKRIADTSDSPCVQFTTYDQGADLKSLLPTSVANENDGPYSVNLYPVIIREGEYIRFDAGAEAA